MPLNVSREEIFTSYEHEVQKLRRLGKELRLKDIDIDEIIHHSFHLLQEQHMTENVKKSYNEKIQTKSVHPYYSFQLIIKIIIIVLLTLTVSCLVISYHKPTYNLVVRNVQELIYPIMKCLRRITLPIVKALPSVTGKFNA
jgi:quinol-cytochrome oxidoreductase complex cytochrome b subunit